MSEDKSKLELIGEIAQANNKNLELIEEINKLQSTLEEIREYIENHYEDRSYDEIHSDILQIIDKGE